MSDRLRAWIRTVVPAAWAALLAWAASLGAPGWLLAPAGGLGEQLLVPLALAGVYAAIRWAEDRLPPWAARLLTGSALTPEYNTAAGRHRLARARSGTLD